MTQPILPYRAAFDGPPIGRRQVLATRAIFLLAGTCVSAWAPLVPYAKSRLELSDGALGLLLLCGGGGAVAAMPPAGVLAGRFGCRAVIGVAALAACGVLPLLAVGPTTGWMALVLVGFGATNGSVDATMNIQAVIVERAVGRSLMSGFHGLWSVGSIVGAGTVSSLIWAGASPLGAVLVVTAATLLLLAVSWAWLLPYGGQRHGPTWALPHGQVVLYGTLCLVLFLAEGSVLDWSAVYLTHERGVDASRAGFGYVLFSAAMTACRLSGDRIVRWLGGTRVVVIGSLVAAVGFGMIVTLPLATLDLVGFTLAGVGLANTVPVIFSATGRQTSMPENLAIPAMTTLAYGGTLCGPALLGFVANAYGLPSAFLLIVTLLLAVAGMAIHARL